MTATAPIPRSVLSPWTAAPLALGAPVLAMLGMGGWPGGAGWGLLLSLGVFAFCAGLWLNRSGAGPLRVALVVLGAHLALWLPFLLVAYAAGQGAARLDYAIGAALFTALAVAWYVLSDHLWATGAVALALAGGLALARRGGRP